MRARLLMVVVACLTLCLVGGELCLHVDTADARRSSFRSPRSSGSFFRRSSPSRSVWGQRSGGGWFGSSKKSSGYSKPGASKSAPSSSQSAQSQGYSKPTQKSSGFSKPSRYSRAQADSLRKQKAGQSLNAYKQETSKFSKTPPPPPSASKYKSDPIFNKAKNYGRFDYNTHYGRRDSYYRGMGWRAPGYAYSGFPRFGMWDALFWWMILDHVMTPGYARAAYDHASDPGYQEWRAEADKLAEDNAELKAKLEALDAKTAGMSGPRDPGYLPPGVPAEVALAGDVLAQKETDKAPLRMATASSTGNYQYFGELLKKAAKGLDVNLQTTAGSMDNLRLLLEGKVDAAMVQSDAFEVFSRLNQGASIISEQTPLYKEAIQMIANRDSGIKSVKDIDPDVNTLYIGPKGSGVGMSWEGLCMEDEHYRKIPTRYASYEDALAIVQKDPNAVMMYVAGLNSGLLRTAEQLAKEHGNLRLVAVDDWDFNDAHDSHGNRIYTFVDIPSKVYPALQKGFIFGHDIETLAVDAVFVVRTEWVEKYGSDAMDTLSFAVMEAQPEVAKRVSGLE